jgi:hypothetical protein
MEVVFMLVKTWSILSLILCVAALAQNKSDFDGQSGSTTPLASSLLDPSRFSMHHMASFGMSSSGTSSVQSQSLYTTMMKYQFASPVTLAFNFSMPIHSTFNQYANVSTLSTNSSAYLRSMPFDASLSWKPTENLLMQFTIIQNGGSQAMYNYQAPFNTLFP